jgi:hypothetical protein
MQVSDNARYRVHMERHGCCFRRAHLVCPRNGEDILPSSVQLRSLTGRMAAVLVLPQALQAQARCVKKHIAGACGEVVARRCFVHNRICMMVGCVGCMG